MRNTTPILMFSLLAGVLTWAPAAALAEKKETTTAGDAARKNVQRQFLEMRRVSGTGALPQKRVASEPDAPTLSQNAEPRRMVVRDLMDRQVRAHRSEVQYCYDQALSLAAKRTSGSVAFELEIERSGSVRQVGVVAGTKQGELERCLQRTIRRWQFPPQESTVSLSYVFVFSTER
jgi:TonB family protein